MPTVGSAGAVRSRRTVPAAVPAAGDQPELLPAVSTDWNWTSVWPSAVIVTEVPVTGDDQLTPPSVDSRCR
jgi:hypothetical protein